MNIKDKPYVRALLDHVETHDHLPASREEQEAFEAQVRRYNKPRLRYVTAELTPTGYMPMFTKLWVCTQYGRYGYTIGRTAEEAYYKRMERGNQCEK